MKNKLWIVIIATPWIITALLTLTNMSELNKINRQERAITNMYIHNC